MAKITIPPVADFRNHIIFLCLYLKVYDGLIEQGKIPEPSFQSILTDDQLASVLHLLTKADPKMPVPVGDEEFTTIYVCYHLSIKVILSRYDELVFNILVADVPGFKALGSFSTVRKNVVTSNAYLIKDTEDKFPESQELKHLSQLLSEITIP